ncbi:MAG: hypothetical protein HY305_04005 [Sphingobacteriales bacterium]|nr:hypothetical protein [Sphingobacteriales bacterium]
MTAIKIIYKLFFTASIIAGCLLFKTNAQLIPASPYQLRIVYVDKDSTFDPLSLKLQTSFNSVAICTDYISTLSSQLNLKGYIAASIDSVALDSNFATINLYLGKRQSWIQLNVDSIDKKALYESGFLSKNFISKPANFVQLQHIQQRILNLYTINIPYNR